MEQLHGATCASTHHIVATLHVHVYLDMQIRLNWLGWARLPWCPFSPVIYVNDKQVKNYFLLVAADRENDTCFQIGFVICVAECVFYAGLDKIH